MPEREAALARGFVLGQDDRIDAAHPRGLPPLRASPTCWRSAARTSSCSACSPGRCWRSLGLTLRARLLVAARPDRDLRAGHRRRARRSSAPAVMGAAGLVAALAERPRSRWYALLLAAAVDPGAEPARRRRRRLAAQLRGGRRHPALVRAGSRTCSAAARERGSPRRAVAEGAAMTIAATVATAPLMAHHFDVALARGAAGEPAGAAGGGAGDVARDARRDRRPAPGDPGRAAELAQLALPRLHRPGRPLARLARLGAARRPARRPGRTSPRPTRSWSRLVGAGARASASRRRGLGPGRAPSSDRRAAARPRGRGPGGGRGRDRLLALRSATGAGRASRRPPAWSGSSTSARATRSCSTRPAASRSWSTPGRRARASPGGSRELGVESLAAVADHPRPVRPRRRARRRCSARSTSSASCSPGRSPDLLGALAAAAGAEPLRSREGGELRSGELRLDRPLAAARALLGAAEADGPEPRSRSCSLAEWRHFSILLTGDAEAEAAPVDPGPGRRAQGRPPRQRGRGARRAARRTPCPKLAVISVGENSYGHPTPETLGRARGARRAGGADRRGRARSRSRRTRALVATG